MTSRIQPPADTARSRSNAVTAAKSKAALRGGILAYFVDQFDIYLPIVVLAPASIYFQSSTVSESTAAILTALVFASTLVARPLGSAVFGHFADTTGRKKSTLVAVAGMGVSTLCIALLPGYETIGAYSIGLLIALRFIDGFFLGGEYTTAVPLAMEWSPKEGRGRVSGLITSTSAASYSFIAALTLLLLYLLPAADLHSPYVQWGWRIPFVIGAGLAAVLFVYYLREVDESSTERTDSDDAHSTSPLMALLTGSNRRALLQVLVLMTGAWLATNMTTAVLPGLLKSHLHLTSKETTVTMMLLTGICAVSYIAAAKLSQRIGRRTFFMGFGLIMATVGAGSYALLMTIGGGYVVTFILAMVVGVTTLSQFGPVAAYLTERFPSHIRASGYGVGFSLALIIPAFYAFYLSGISTFMPNYYAPIVLVVLAGLLISVGAALGPETKDVDMGNAAVDSAVER